MNRIFNKAIYNFVETTKKVDISYCGLLEQEVWNYLDCLSDLILSWSRNKENVNKI